MRVNVEQALHVAREQLADDVSTSPPEQNARPSPVMTSARSASSPSSSSRTSPISR